MKPEQLGLQIDSPLVHPEAMNFRPPSWPPPPDWLSSGMVDEPSLQFLLKHLSRVMTLYYGCNHSRLNLNQETRPCFSRPCTRNSAGSYASGSPPNSSARSAHNERRTSWFSSRRRRPSPWTKRRDRARSVRGAYARDFASRIAHVLTVATKLSRIASGGDSNGAGCPDLLVDITKEPEIRTYEAEIDAQLKVVYPDSPRHNRLQAEKRAIRKYYDISAS